MITLWLGVTEEGERRLFGPSLDDQLWRSVWLRRRTERDALSVDLLPLHFSGMLAPVRGTAARHGWDVGAA